MKFANALLDGNATLLLIDSHTQQCWPVPELAPSFKGDMVDLVQSYDRLKASFKPQGAGRPLAHASLLAPIDAPRRNVFCVGKNYHDHAAEFSKSGFDSSAKEGETSPDKPIFFTKPASTIIGPDAVIPRHKDVTSQLDYEIELTVVIGKAGRGIRKADAYQHVFGYTIINDFTARDLQKSHRQWFLGKSLDGFCPMGPWLVTADEVDVENLSVKTWVNGELRQDSNTRQLIFDIPTLIETLSAGIELQPGDLIATGTPVGVGIGFDPPRFVDSGDEIAMEIDGLGRLTNRVA